MLRRLVAEGLRCEPAAAEAAEAAGWGTGTGGCSMADLAGLAREAAMHALREQHARAPARSARGANGEAERGDGGGGAEAEAAAEAEAEAGLGTGVVRLR